MVNEKLDKARWNKEFYRKFMSFMDKSPVLVDLETSNDSVVITHKGTKQKYQFVFDYAKNVKDFINDIRRVLIEKHYPRIEEPITETYILTPEELAKKVEEGADIKTLNRFELRKVGYRVWLISKTIMWKNIVILELEKFIVNGEEKPFNKQLARYKFNRSLAIFLKHYRTGHFKSLEDASRYFFENSVFINEIESNTDTEKNNCTYYGNESAEIRPSVEKIM
jgi:hypothetical protein